MPKRTMINTYKSVATVTKKGKVKGIKAGKATIMARVAGKKLKCMVTVKNKAPNYNSSVMISADDPFTVNVGETKAVQVVTDRGFEVA